MGEVMCDVSNSSKTLHKVLLGSCSNNPIPYKGEGSYIRVKGVK